MNKRAFAQVLVILLLLLLLAWGLGGAPKKIIRRSGPADSKVRIRDAPLSPTEQGKEEPADVSNSAPEERKPIITPVSHSGWVNKGSYEVFGVVQNIGEAVGRQVKANVTFKGGERKLIGRAEAFIDKPRLAPGEKSRFKVILRTEQPDAVDNYVLIMKVSR